MKLYKQIQLQTAGLIREAAFKLLEQEWNFHSERLIRMPLEGNVFVAASAEFVELGFGKIASWSIFCRGPCQAQIIHVDGQPGGRVHSAVLVPVIGCDNSRMQWFDESQIKLVETPTIDGKTVFLRDISGRKDHQVIDEVAVAEPMIAAVGVPHRAVAGVTPRALVSIKFYGNPHLV